MKAIHNDGDDAGKKAMLKYLPQLISMGFAVDVCRLPGNLDPDDYSRKFQEKFEDKNQKEKKIK